MFVALPLEEQKIRENELSLDLARAQAQLTGMQGAALRAYRVDDIYARWETDGLALVQAELTAKKATLDTDFPADAPHVIIYLAAHPTSGGHTATAWEIRKKTVGITPGDIVYSHAVNWDSNARILEGELQEQVFNDVRYHPVFGSQIPLGGLNAAVTSLSEWISLLEARDALFDE